MTTIYFNQRTDRKNELIFFNFLKKKLGKIEHVNKDFLLPSELLLNYINIPKVIKALKTDNTLSLQKKLLTIKALTQLPENVLVARDIKKVSVDFTISMANELFFIEFHENQHRNLSVARTTKVFCNNNNEHFLPRFAQRFLKDVWRWENLSNYKIIWWDWFEQNQNTLSIEEFFVKGNKEYFINNKFSFSNLF